MRITSRTLTLWLISAALLLARSGPGGPSGWQLLLDNEPEEAAQAFNGSLQSADPGTVGSAHRGLSAVKRFLGDDGEATDHTFQAFLADGDTLALNAAWINSLTYARTAAGHFSKSGQAAHRALIAKPGILSGEHLASHAYRLANDGRLGEANAVIDRMGVVRTFRMTGPFENISGSGYRKVYPPEQEIRIDLAYSGKDGGRVEWFPFHNESPVGWVFTQYNFPSYNAVTYYFANVTSARDQEVHLGFGASGAFAVFLNDTRVLADSVFRNTGTDVFIQKVRLFRGDNKLLVKLAHESRPANFMVRFMGTDGLRVPGVSFSDTPGSYRVDTATFADPARSPMTEAVVGYLDNRIAADSTDLEAALLLMDYCNGTELTDRGQKLARKYVARHPRSSLWRSLYSESLLRSGKSTDAQTEVRSAYKLCHLNKSAWGEELSIVSSTASPRDLLSFIERSPEPFRTSLEAILARLGAHARDENETEATRAMSDLERLHGQSTAVVKLLANYHAGQGDVRKAEKLLERALKWERTSDEFYSQLAALYLKMGNRAKALKVIGESLKYSPNSPGLYSYLAKLSVKSKDYDAALRYAGRALALTPTSTDLLNLQGAILAETGRKQEAVETFRKSIAYRYDNFNAWDQLLPLTGQPAMASLAPLPDLDTLWATARHWRDLDGDNGSIIAYMADVFLYPSRCSRERHFLVVHLATQGAIDTWKEYRLSFNPYYQVAHVARALSKAADGKETPADVERGLVVFKTLQPGDQIVLEWTLESHYQGEMARHVWGERSFDLPYPVFKSRLRLVTPDSDTIPYAVQGDSIQVSVDSVPGFRITAFTRDPYKNPARESYMLIDPPTSPRVTYSTLESWSRVADWYRNLTENKVEQTTELRRLADSLCAGATTTREKVDRIHRYITNTIRYSFVPFRQSAWVPQPAREVLASRIGDCKDMSSLGKSLLDYAGIPSALVLVDTRDQNSIYPSFIGPNFNHCIVSCRVGSENLYLDMTDQHLSAGYLPRMDQGALALRIEESADSLIHLPADTSVRRVTIREIASNIDATGKLSRQVTSTRTGVYAGQMRGWYRFLAPEEREKSLQKALVDDWPDVTVDTFDLGNLDTLADTVRYTYSYSVANGVTLNGKTAIVPLNLPDRIAGEHFPNEANRHYDIDMAHTWFANGLFVGTGTLTVPSGWRLMSQPDPVKLEAPHGTYELTVTQNASTVRFRRYARFDFDAPIAATEGGALREFLSRIAQADNTQLIFTTGD